MMTPAGAIGGPVTGGAAGPPGAPARRVDLPVSECQQLIACCAELSRERCLYMLDPVHERAAPFAAGRSAYDFPDACGR